MRRDVGLCVLVVSSIAVLVALRGGGDNPPVKVQPEPPPAENIKPPETRQANADVQAILDAQAQLVERELRAAGDLKIAKRLQQAKRTDAAKDRLVKIVEEYPGTNTAAVAEKLLQAW